MIPLLTANLCFSQQTEGLKLIKNKYDIELKNIMAQYDKDTSKKISRKEFKIFKDKRNNQINILEKNRNEEYLEELSKIKLSKQVGIPEPTIPNKEGEIAAEYPRGNDFFRQELADNFYSGTIDGKGKINCKLSFIIEKDGSITDVKGVGDNENFNRQAELAVYLSEYKWKPATSNGIPVRYRFTTPLQLIFD
ncbi:energy transducer TonB [Chryseobacterium sp. CT-SW4]|uniref:hypothetical protein n=1 Tax=Chryseobacterium sp. SW-1 TaxID=3157343 RepID=UPI003B0122F2